MAGLTIRNFADAVGGVFYNAGVPYDSTGALLADLTAYQTLLTNSAGLAAALSDETGFAGGGVAVGNNAPTITGMALIDGVTTADNSLKRLILGRYDGGNLFSYIAPSPTSSGFVFNNAAVTAELMRFSNNGVIELSGTVASTSTTTGTLVVSGGAGVAGALNVGTTIKSSGATSGVGYATGAGGAVTQITGRTTGVTLNTVSGAITLVSAAGSVTWQSFTVINSAVEATDVIKVCQKSGTDLNMIHVTAVAAGSFRISFATTGGLTVEQPVFNFAVIKAVAA